MLQSPAISPAPPARASQDFAVLRGEALDEIQMLGAETWTDHNLHDPGITIMEAFCYAATELGLRLDLGIADLIESGRGRAAPDLPAAESVLPSAPVTADDLRRQLLDHYLVGDASVRPGASDRIAYYADKSAPAMPFSYDATTGSRLTPRGLFNVLLSFSNPALNANTYSFKLTVGAETFTVDYALPHWDEKEAAPFRAATTTLVSSVMQNAPDQWRRMDGPLTYLGRTLISYTDAAGAGTTETWVALRITSPVSAPVTTLPQILAAATAQVQAVSPGSLLDRFRKRVTDVEAAAATVRRYLQSWRNLCEDPVRLAVSRVQEIAVHARLAVTRSTGLEEQLAQILFDIDTALSPAIGFATIDERRRAGVATTALFDGPLLTHGFLTAPDEEPLVRDGRIILSDVLNIIMRDRAASSSSLQENPIGRDVMVVTELSLSNFDNNRSISRDAQNCLKLLDVSRYRPRLSVGKSRISLVRDDIEVVYDMAEVERRFEALWADRMADSRLAAFDATLPVPVGETLPVGDYYPFQYDLPSIYGVTEAGLPVEAQTARRHQALQLRAYLMLLEQFLADSTEQLSSINRLFSPSASEHSTYFPAPLYQLSDLDQLLRAFPGGSFATFAANKNNDYVGALRAAGENEASALDRRNRMLDHLLARQGENALAWGQELHRWAQKSVLHSTGAADLTMRSAVRRTDANRELLRTKAEFLADLPRLSALRLQAFGDPLQWRSDLVDIQPAASGGFRWTVSLDGVPAFESLASCVTRGEALTRAREVIRLAGTAAYYGARNFPGGHRYVLRSGAGGAAELARGTTGFGTSADAAAAGAATRPKFAALLVAQSRTAMERRIDHLTGLRVRQRRGLLTPVATFFRIADPGGAAFNRRWELLSDAGPAGTMLLHGPTRFDAVLNDAEKKVNGDIEEALEYALDPWNYEISATPIRLRLVDRDGAEIGIAPPVFANAAAAASARDAIIDLLYSRYSAEGFHMVETLLLRPVVDGDRFLGIPVDGGFEADPYSQRLVLVFPSGYARNFADDAAERKEVRPHRFRDREFRAHAERTARQSCPAHIVPEIRWVDRELPSTPAADGSFDSFEARYFAWLDTVVIAGATVAAATAARNALVTSVNAILGV